MARKLVTSGYEGLLVEILAQAVRDATNTKSDGQSKMWEVKAKRWLKDGNIGYLSLNRLCLHLDLDPDFVRRRVEKEYGGNYLSSSLEYNDIYNQD
tara:strand:+ start:10393 stop:10680 length:288 start_codon:yes stop_codon:yes gene_type:complete